MRENQFRANYLKVSKYGLKTTKFNEKCEKWAENNKNREGARILSARIQIPRENYHARILIPLR